MNDLPSHAPESVTRGFVEVPITGNFLFRNPLKGEARTVLVGFHGYAENAEIQFERLLTIPGSDKDLLCSIQALHPFYRTKTGEVVASWMTRFQREQAIIENRCFVDRVLDRLRERVPDHVPLVLVGFSQGAAMAYRAGASQRHRPTALVILGGDFPSDLAEGQKSILPPVFLGRGNRDRLYPPEQFEKDLRSLESSGAKVIPCVFEGGHEWNEEFARRVGEWIVAVHVHRRGLNRET